MAKRSEKYQKNTKKSWVIAGSISLLVLVLAGVAFLIVPKVESQATSKPSANSKASSVVDKSSVSSNESSSPSVAAVAPSAITLITENNQTFAVQNGQKLTGEQTVAGNTYYFDPTTAAEVGQLRPMTGNYWQESTMLQPYPDLSKYSNLSFHVSISQNRTYLESNGQVIYVFYSSTGEDQYGGTPTGTYQIDNYRAPSFYSAREAEGANNSVGININENPGLYLFHSVPVDSTGAYIVANGELLGKAKASHGCIHLSVADSKWVYDQQFPAGTPVVIAN